MMKFFIFYFSNHGIKGMIAESWTSNTDHSRWSFKINKHYKFENGELITPKIVAESLKRIILALRKKASQENFLGNST